MSVIKRIQKLLMKPLALLDNKYIAGAVKIFLILYAATIAPKLPKFLAKILKNPVAKLLVLFLIVYTGVKDPMMSLLIAVGFTVSMMTLNKLETATSLDEIIQGAVDVPQSLLNDVVDGAQDLTMEAAGLVGSPVEEVVGVANKAVDAVQGIANNIIDGAQSILKTPEDKKENFSMEDRNLNIEVPDMSSLDGLSGFDGAEVGASINFEEPAALQ
jgi:hypothetical protein